MPSNIPAILCTVDFSTFSPLVVAHGAALAQRAEARLHLIHAVHNPQDNLHPLTLFERGGGLKTRVGYARQRMAEMVPPGCENWDPVFCYGDPVEQIAACTHRLRPGLVVSASHGVSGFRRLLVGTVVERLTRALPRPMLVVKAPPGDTDRCCEGFRSVVISCDDQGYWQRAAPLLGLLQPDPNAPIHLVHALEAPSTADPPRGAANMDNASYDQLQREAQARLSAKLHRQARSLLPHATALSTAVAPGIPQELVLRAARERGADLILVGVRHSGTVGRWISGSTTEALLRRAPCAVLTVPEPEADIRHEGGAS